MTLEQVQEIKLWFAKNSPSFAEEDYVMSYYSSHGIEEFCRETGQDEYVYWLMKLKYQRPNHTAGKDATASVDAKSPSKPQRTEGQTSHACVATPSPDDKAAEIRREKRRAARERERSLRRVEDAAEETATCGPAPSDLKHPASLAAMAIASTPPHPTAKSWKSYHGARRSSEGHTKEIAEVVKTICERYTAETNGPIALSAFLHAFRLECKRRGWVQEAIAGSTTLRHALEQDRRVIWAGAERFWYFDWKEHRRSISLAIERDALVGYEYSTRFFFRKECELMSRLSIETPRELYEILRRIYVDTEEEVVFCDQLSFGFGKIDRQRQVKRFVANHAGEPRNVLATKYERKYGFPANVAKVWIDLFARPNDVPSFNLAKHESVRGTTKGAAKETRRADAAQSHETEAAIDESPASVQTAPSIEPKTLTIADFLKRELNRDVCDAGLIRERFQCEFPGKPDITYDAQALREVGFYESHGLFFRVNRKPGEYFAQLLSSHPSFSRGDPGFEEAIWKHPAFRATLNDMLSNYRILLYERPDIYVTFSRLQEATGARLVDVESYAPSVVAAVPRETPFTIYSLRGVLGFTHPLYDIDMPYSFYEGLLEKSSLVGTCTFAGTKIFIAGEDGRFSAISFIESFITTHEGIYREDVPGLLRKEYGIDCPMNTLVAIVYNSNVYHDDIWDTYYSSIEIWKQGARNELT